MASPTRSPDWIRARLGRAGVTEWRPSGDGSILDEPVLVCVGAGANFWEQIYDQHGRLLASTLRAGRAEKLKREALPEEMRGSSYVNERDERALTLSWVSGRLLARSLRAISPGGEEVGTIDVRGSSRGHILVAGRALAFLRPPPVLGVIGLGRSRGRYSLVSPDGAIEGRVTQRGFPRPHCVVEIDDAALRPLGVAAATVVKRWLESSGGG